MEEEGSDSVVLSYHDALIRQTDRHLLTGPFWLNDTVIHFHWQYLQHAVFASFEQRVAFVAPDVVQLLRLLADEQQVIELLEPLQLPEKQLVLLPLNNCQLLDAPGGSHWSLVVFHRDSGAPTHQGGRFWHYDSLRGCNQAIARQMASRLSPLLAGQERGCEFVEAECGVQDNSHDCGVFVLCHARRLIERCVVAHDQRISQITVSQCEVDSLRTELLEIIDHLSKQQG